MLFDTGSKLFEFDPNSPDVWRIVADNLDNVDNAPQLSDIVPGDGNFVVWGSQATCDGGRPDIETPARHAPFCDCPLPCARGCSPIRNDRTIAALRDLRHHGELLAKRKHVNAIATTRPSALHNTTKARGARHRHNISSAPPCTLACHNQGVKGGVSSSPASSGELHPRFL